MAKALHTLMGTAHSLVVEHSIADGVFCEVFNTQNFTEADCSCLKTAMQNIVDSDLPIEKIMVKTEEALDSFLKYLKTYWSFRHPDKRTGVFNKIYNKLIKPKKGGSNK